VVAAADALPPPVLLAVLAVLVLALVDVAVELDDDELPPQPARQSSRAAAPARNDARGGNTRDDISTVTLGRIGGLCHPRGTEGDGGELRSPASLAWLPRSEARKCTDVEPTAASNCMAMPTEQLQVVHVDHSERGGWDVALPGQTAHITCPTPEHARRVALLYAANRRPCELVMRDAYHRVVLRELIATEDQES
jgi:hypothetical protein